jgi:hypothetical protein
MKIIKLLNLQTPECEIMPTNEFEVETLKRECFNEGWWKGFTNAAISITLGLIIGTIIAAKVMSDVEKA